MAPTILLECTAQKSSQHSSFTMMGKAQRFSRGHSSGFIPDYRHAVETVGESEGFVSSGRVDSEDSSAPSKRKCISLNTDKCDGFNVPMQVISISKMSSSERKEFEIRLRAELEQIQILQKKILSRAVNGVAISSTTDASGKKRLAVGQNTAQLKRGHSGRSEPGKSAPRPTVAGSNNVALTKQCERLVNRLLQHPYGWVFKEPVNEVELKIPDYYTIIKNPMDLGTAKSRLVSGAYANLLDFASDVRLTFKNAKTYNPPGNDVHVMADILSKEFESKWKLIKKKIPPVDSSVAREAEAVKPPSQPKKRKAPSVTNVPVVPVSAESVKNDAGSVKEKMTAEEKHKLSSRLESLIPELPEHIIEFLRRSSGNQSQSSEDEIEIDIDALGDETLFELRKLLDEFCPEKGSKQERKAEPGEMEIFNESGISNSSMQPYKVNEPPADEEVDIVDNDLPVSSYPPVEIEKDTALRSSKYSSSSSSSSDSGSSSSDSDSASSSGSESLVAKGSSPTNNLKETTISGTAFEQEKGDVMNQVDGDRSIDGDSEQPEESDHPKTVSAEIDGCQVGGNALPERQVSPEKLYRAALLRSRFADTILKAREKTLDKGEKGDPEKLRREREELKRQQREERARLQAEAKAAEDARRQAEAKAAAEAKRKRELEREAARQALLKMEKTVEINENSQFLKDLEMLRSAPGEHLPSSVDETSPDHSQDGIGGFKFRGNNPLEQLGLYMKVDDEEEDEVEPSGAPANDVEEGEID